MLPLKRKFFGAHFATVFLVYFSPGDNDLDRQQTQEHGPRHCRLLLQQCSNSCRQVRIDRK